VRAELSGSGALPAACSYSVRRPCRDALRLAPYHELHHKPVVPGFTGLPRFEILCYYTKDHLALITPARQSVRR
jgi:hypothetical protein